MSDLSQELETAKKAVAVAAQICQSIQKTISPETLEKKDRSPVTVADFASQAVICKMLSENFPSVPVIGEEGADELRNPEKAPFVTRIREELEKKNITGSDAEIFNWIDTGQTREYSGRFWTLDPIDGTKGFLRKEQYAIALALIIQGKISLAVLGCPNLPLDPNQPHGGTLFFARRDQETMVQALEGDSQPQKVEVSKTTDTKESRFTESVESGHSSHDLSAQIAEALGITKAPLRMDSQAKYAVVARGEADIYMRLPTRPGYVEKIWDHAAGAFIIEQAGGKATDAHGKELEFHHGRELKANQGIIVSNGILHQQVLAELHKGTSGNLGVPA